MGNLYIENGNLTDAKEDFASIISQFPSSNVAVKGKLGLVRIDIESKNYSAAQDRAKDVAAARTDEFGAEAQYLSGLAYCGAKDWKNAIIALLQVSNVFPSYDQWVAKSYVALGDAYVATEDPRNAKSAYQNALKFKRETETAAEAQKRLERLQKL
jgi:outer membrane protein assembly factor BamD (BamD/ComL family)